jgi:tyrosine aminotransferase
MECVGKVDGYTDVVGLESAREAVAKKFGGKNYTVSKDDVYLTAGGSMALWSVMNLLAGPGDNYLFPSPGFPLTLTIAASMGLTPKHYHLQADNNWEADIQEMEKLIDDKTRFLLINDPSNPLGSVWSAEHKRQIIELCARKRIPILADEIYEEMSYNVHAPTFAELVKPEEVDKVAVFKCSGLTKRYLAPGWRMGWLILYASPQTQEFYRSRLRGIFNVILMPTTIMQSALPGILNNENNYTRLTERIQMMGINQQALQKGL